jgi:hypothetical protein
VRALDADLQSLLGVISKQSMHSVQAALDARPIRWEQQYDPTEVSALQQALEARAPAYGVMPAAPGPRGSRTPNSAHRRACVYGSDGQLLLAPEGLSCTQRTRTDEPEAVRQETQAEGSVGCVYGSRGQLLYASKGARC